MYKIERKGRTFQVYSHQEFRDALIKRMHQGELEIITSGIVPYTLNSHTFTLYVDYVEDRSETAVYNLSCCFSVGEVYLISNNVEHGWMVFKDAIYAF